MNKEQTIKQNEQKVLICKCICEVLFPIIDNLRQAPTESFLGHPRYKDSLYSRLSATKIMGGNDINNDSNFMHAILSIWHKMRYNEPDWVVFSEVVDEAKYEGLHYDQMKKKIANSSIVESIKEQANIVWYLGKSWKPYRDKIGSTNINDYEKAGILLAQFWPWDNFMDNTL